MNFANDKKAHRVSRSRRPICNRRRTGRGPPERSEPQDEGPMQPTEIDRRGAATAERRPAAAFYPLVLRWIATLPSRGDRRGGRLRKRLTRGWYQFLSFMDRRVSMIFMNYGYAPPDDGATPPLELEPGDESDRYCIQLYHRVASAVDLRGKQVLEVGSGRGGGSSYVARYLRPRLLTGMDYAARAVRFSERAHRAAEPPIHRRRRRGDALRRRRVRRGAERRIVALLPLDGAVRPRGGPRAPARRPPPLRRHAAPRRDARRPLGVRGGRPGVPGGGGDHRRGPPGPAAGQRPEARADPIATCRGSSGRSSAASRGSRGPAPSNRSPPGTGSTGGSSSDGPRHRGPPRPGRCPRRRGGRRPPPGSLATHERPRPADDRSDRRPRPPAGARPARRRRPAPLPRRPPQADPLGPRADPPPPRLRGPRGRARPPRRGPGGGRHPARLRPRRPRPRPPPPRGRHLLPRRRADGPQRQRRPLRSDQRRRHHRGPPPGGRPLRARRASTATSTSAPPTSPAASARCTRWRTRCPPTAPSPTTTRPASTRPSAGSAAPSPRASPPPSSGRASSSATRGPAPPPSSTSSTRS